MQLSNEAQARLFNISLATIAYAVVQRGGSITLPKSQIIDMARRRIDKRQIASTTLEFTLTFPIHEPQTFSARVLARIDVMFKWIIMTAPGSIFRISNEELNSGPLPEMTMFEDAAGNLVASTIPAQTRSTSHHAVVYDVSQKGRVTAIDTTPAPTGAKVN